MSNEIISETVRHECEKHDLAYLGLVGDLEALKDRVAGKTEIFPDFRKTKEQILSVLYEMIDYRSFAERCKAVSMRQPESSMRHCLRRMLREMEKRTPDISPDRELKVGKTIAWHLSEMIFNGFYDDFRRSDDTFATPLELKRFFAEMANETYPLSFSRFMTRLETGDGEFWNRVGELLLKLSQLVTIPGLSSSIYRDIAGGEIAGESYLIIKQTVDEKKVQFGDALHFRKYSWNICKNKCYEYMRKSRNHRTDSLEDIFLSPEDDALLDGIAEKEEDMMYDVNPDNPYEMAKLLSLVLYRREHPLHQTVVSGEEERVRLLMDVAVEGLSYEQIIERRYRDSRLSASERRKLNARLRQDYLRIRKKLINRLEETVRKNGKMLHQR